MNDFAAIQAYDLLRFAVSFEERLGAARHELEVQAGHPREQGWMAEAVSLVSAERPAVVRMLDDARHLPELGEVRLELADELQERWVDALEKLLAGITYHSSARDPVIEAIFPHQKFPALRRANRETAEHFSAELERRLGSAYVKRILSQETYAFSGAVLEQVRRAAADWRSCFAEGGMPETDAEPIRRGLLALATKLDLAVQQAKLLAQAALLPFPGRFDELGLGAKPKRRAPRFGDQPSTPPGQSPAAETTPGLDQGAPPGNEETPAATEDAPAAESEPAPSEVGGSPPEAAPVEAPPTPPARGKGKKRG